MTFNLVRFQEEAFDFISYLTYILYAAVLFGISYSAPKYLYLLNTYVPIYVAFFLLIRFNKFRSFKGFTDLDRKIAFSAGLFILLSSSATAFVQNYFNNFITEEKSKFS